MILYLKMWPFDWIKKKKFEGEVQKEKQEVEMGIEKIKRLAKLGEEKRKWTIRMIKDYGEEGKNFVKEAYSLAINKFSEMFGLPLDDAPELKMSKGEKMVFNRPGNIIYVGTEEFISTTPEDLGGEIGHYLRARFTGKLYQKISKGEEVLTDEFFDFLGGKMLYQSMDSQEREIFFPEGEPTIERTYEYQTKKEISQELGTTGVIKRRLDKEYKEAETKGDEIRMKEIYTEAQKAGVGEYYRTLTHYRGYEAASRVDTSKIHDWKKLFSMPDKEVRLRFFGREEKDMDYSGL